MQPVSFRARAFFVALSSLLAFQPDLQASDIIWKNPFFGGSATGDWSDSKNWKNSAGFPNQIPRNGTPNPAETWRASIESASVTMDLPTITITVLDLFHTSSLSISQFNSLDLTARVFTNSPDSILNIQDHATLTVREYTAFNNLGSVNLLSTGGLTQMRLRDGGYIEGTVNLTALNANSIDRLTGVTGTESITNSGVINGAGFVTSFARLDNEGTIIGGGFAQPTLHIASNTFYTSTGTLKSIPGGAVQIDSPNFLNLVGGNTLFGGKYDIAGRLVIATSGITTINPFTDVTLRGDGFITNFGGSINALYKLDLNAGNLSVLGGGNHEFGAPFIVNANGANLNVSENSVMSFLGAIQNSPNGTINVGEGATSGTLWTHGLLNLGTLNALVGNSVADFRGGGVDSFNNLAAFTETFYNGIFKLGANATMMYDAGSGAHGGEIIFIAPSARLDLNRGGQIQYGPAGLDALAQLNGNAGKLNLLGGTHTFTPLDGTFVNNPDFSGDLKVANPGTSVQIAGHLANEGKIHVVNQGELHVNGALINGLKGDLTIDGGKMVVDGAITNDDGIDIKTGGHLIGSGPLTNHSAVYISNFSTLSATTADNRGTLSVSGGGSAVFFSGVFQNGIGSLPGPIQIGVGVGDNTSTTSDFLTASDFVNNDAGIVYIAANGVLSANTFQQINGTTLLVGGLLNSPAVTTRNGIVKGHGLIFGNLNNTGATVNPDGEKLEISGNFTQTVAGVLSESFGSRGYLHVDGNADLSGVLKGDLAAGIIPKLGDAYEVVHFDGTLTGDFSSLDLLSLTGGLFLKEMVYSHDILLQVSMLVQKPGDANYDGKVDADDYFLTDKGFLLSLTGWGNGDFNGDGKVDADDYFIIDKAFLTQGATPALEIQADPSAVPEPSTFVLAFAAIVCLRRLQR